LTILHLYLHICK